MSFLPNKIFPYSDETLESFLIRLCRANHFESYHDLSIEVKAWLEEHHPTIAGAFPLSLDRVNVYHSRQSSSRRVQALQLLEQLIKLPRFSLLDISFKHTTSVDKGQYAQVRYKANVIPKEFIRSDNVFPICIECLKNSDYVRFEWHISPITCCPKHSQKLLNTCPRCHEPLNYMLCESIGECVCGHNLLLSGPQVEETDEWRQDSSYQQELSACNLSQKLALLSFVQKMVPEECFSDFMLSWKVNLESVIISRVKETLVLSVVKPNKASFDYLTGGLLSVIAQTNELPEIFVKQVVILIIEISANSPRSNIANIGDSLLSIRDAAVLLRTTINDIYRLYETGILVLGKRINANAKLETYKPVFRLRDVSAIALSCSEYSINQSAW